MSNSTKKSAKTPKAQKANSGRTLVIVESPAKAKTIAKYLGDGYAVESSIGHIRDLPKNAAEIPERYKKQPWARLGLDIENDFTPLYVVDSNKKETVQRLKQLADQADEIILATDDDREGESIAWHLYQELKPRVPVRRMVFHEITKEAIAEAIAQPREIDSNLVEAQEARRALDRLYGYEVSPVLWRKIAPKLSAGRVQSVATRMLVERERERMQFVAATWWDVAVLASTAQDETFPCRLLSVNEQRLATGKDFDPRTGQLSQLSQSGQSVQVGQAVGSAETGEGKEGKGTPLLLSEDEAQQLAQVLQGQPLTISRAEEKPTTKRPPAPFITSTLQQEGSRKLNFAATRTMRAAQKLYEAGYITYMRTDSTNLSSEAVQAARKQVREMYGEAFLSPEPRVYAKKAKNAQEAHEAIRPAGSSFKTPESLKAELGAMSDEWRLYDLIWKRTVACQMADARGRSLRVRLTSAPLASSDLPLSARLSVAVCLFSASGHTIDFAGFLRAYVEGSDDPTSALEDRDTPLPALQEGQSVTAKQARAESHETQPPSRYTEASLVQALEAAGIGRPSTYASILGTIQSRGYAIRRGPALVPTWTAFATSALLEHHFGNLVDYDFTARMEEDLDDIAGGRARRVPYLRRFYLGEDGEGMALRPLVERQMGEIDARSIATIAVPRLAGSGIELRVGRYGAYIQREDSKASLPDEIIPDELTLEKAEELLSLPQGDLVLGQDPETGHTVVAKNGRYGPYVVLLAQPEDTEALKTASLFPTDQLAELTLERALQLLSLPRLVGVLDGEEVWAQNGKFGPYIKRGNDSRSLGSHEKIFGVTLPEAEALFQQPRFGGRTAAPPLKTFSIEGKPDIALKVGRFGPYLTDGERNATLRKGENEQTLDAHRALEILEERGKMPAKKAKSKATGKKAPAKKAPAKKASANKTAPRKAATQATLHKLSWDDLKAHLDILQESERRLIVETRDKGRKVEEVAPELGLDVKQAKGMVLQVSKKLNQAARAGADLGAGSEAGGKEGSVKRVTKSSQSSKAKKPAPKVAAKFSWDDLKAHLDILPETERRLIVETRDKGRKVEEVAPELGLDVKQAKGMVLQVSKKLNQAARVSDS